MKQYLIVIMAVALLIAGAGCADSNREASEAPDSSADEPAAVAAPPSPREESAGPEASAGAPVSSSSSLPDEPAEDKPDNENPATRTVPEVNAAVFYDENEGGANLSVLCTGVGRYGLSYENSKSLLAYMDFSALVPTDQKENMEIDSPDPGIVFTAPDFSYELRLDQNTNIAVYEVGGNSRYYYAMPAGFYERAYEWTHTYQQYNYNTYPMEEEEASNVTTGHDPDAEQ